MVELRIRTLLGGAEKMSPICSVILPIIGGGI